MLQLICNTPQQEPYDKLYGIATALDPRCKGIDFNDTLAPIDYLEVEYKKMENQLVAQLVPDQTLNLSSSFMSSVFTTTQRMVSTKSEVDQYVVLQPIGPLDDPIKWWAAWSSTFPKLVGLAKQYLAIPVTSVPSEHLFSASGIIMNKKRTRLTPAKFGKLVFCQANRKRYGTLFPDVDDQETDEESEFSD